MSERLLRWLPAVVAPAAVAAVVITVPLSAGAAGSLPTKTPEQVLELVARSADLPGFSGTVRQTSDLGLPELPAGLTSGSGSGSGADTGSANAVELLTGTHTARVFEAGADQRRVQVLDSMTERDLIRNGNDLWLWDAKHDAATHVTVPERTADGTDVMSPADAARHALDAIDDSTAVAVDGSASVAGRDAYRLVLTPRSSGTTVGSVGIAVDAVTGLPLQVEVTARGATSPAFSVGFTAVDLTKPDASIFDFQPPSGATVHQESLPTRSGSSDGERPVVTGSGWDAVVTADPGTSATAGITSDGVFQQLTKAVDGGRVLSTTLVNVLVTDDGRILAGAVPVARLEAVAAG
jgi:outer membrane lipoprotein-sorting protein